MMLSESIYYKSNIINMLMNLRVDFETFFNHSFRAAKLQQYFFLCNSLPISFWIISQASRFQWFRWRKSGWWSMLKSRNLIFISILVKCGICWHDFCTTIWWLCIVQPTPYIIWNCIMTWFAETRPPYGGKFPKNLFQKLFKISFFIFEKFSREACFARMIQFGVVESTKW